MKLREKIKRFWTLDVHNHEGFTLVELIIVIAILAILSSVAVVGYSSYVEKANKAADEALLYEINQAFRAACIENFCDVFDISKAAWDKENMTIASVEEDTAHPIVASFAEYFEVSNPTFKVIEEIFFNPNTHMWEEDGIMTFNFGGKTITLNASDVAILQGDNAFSARGAAALLGDVGALETYLAGGFIGADILEEVGASADFFFAVGGYLGLKQEDYADTDAYFEAIGTALDALENENAVTNALIMYSASNAASVTDAQIEALFSGSVTSNIEVKNQDGTRDNAQTMANAALAYGMYTAYLQQHPEIDPATNAGSFTNVVNSAGFAAYMQSEQGKADLEAYMAAMNMISDNTDNSEITGSILEDGISSNDDLEDLMKDVMGN